MNGHVVTTTPASRVLAPHPEPVDWSNDGVTVGPEIVCEAAEFVIGSSSFTDCHRFAVVELATSELGPDGDVAGSVLLCGRHYGLHRTGNVLVLR